MKRLCLFIILFCSFCLMTKAQDNSIYEKHSYVQAGDTLPYRLLLPVDYDPAKKYPLILFLHGSGERGRDNELQLVHGAKLFLSDSVRKNYPAIVVFPQCPLNSYWSNVQSSIDTVSKKRIMQFPVNGEPTIAMKMLVSLLEKLERDYKLNKQQIFVGGLSMGGMGTFELVGRKPKFFAAAFPICGGANPAIAKKIKEPTWWIFHGLKDDVVDPEFSKQMAVALEKVGADVKLTLYPEANHNSWDPAFAEKNLLSWLFSQTK